MRLVLRPTPASPDQEERFRYLQDAAPAALDVKPAVLAPAGEGPASSPTSATAAAR